MYELGGRKIQLISGKDCCAETAFQEFMTTKRQYRKANGMFFYQYVQSFSPEEKITPQQAHEIGCKFAEYFKGHEVLIATHTDAGHIHTHFLINSVSFENAKKLQMHRGSIYDLRRYSDEICKEHGLSIVQPKQKSNIQTREYRAALKGESWKFQLINAIDAAIAASRSKREFFNRMEEMGYQVKWQRELKYITYTTPDGKRCRDNKLHEEKYLKERMEALFGYRETQGIEQAGEFDRSFSDQSPAVRNTAGSPETVSGRDGDDSDYVSPVRGADCSTAYTTGYSGNVGRGGKAPDNGAKEPHKRGETGGTVSTGQSETQPGNGAGGQNSEPEAGAPSTGLIPLAGTPKMGGTGSGLTNTVLGAALALANLVDQPKEQAEDVPKRHARRRPKKKPSPNYDQGMER